MGSERRDDRPGGEALSLLLVEDNPVVATVLRRVLERSCDVTPADRVASATRAIGERDFDVVLCDYDLPDGRGGEVLREAMRVRPGAARLLMSGGEVAELEAWTREGLVEGWLPKPFPADDFAALVRQLREASGSGEGRRR